MVILFFFSNGYFKTHATSRALSPADYLGFIEIELHKTSDLGEIRVGDEGNGRGELGKMEGSHV